MTYQGSCHCGAVAYEVDGEIDQVIECNCSHCSRKGYLLWFVPRGQMRLLTGETALGAYTFNKRQIQHRFCERCGCAPFAFGEHPPGTPVAAINVRCLEDIEPANLKIVQVDGRQL